MSIPPNSDSAQLGPYFLIARTRNQGPVEHDLASRYGQDGHRAPDALDAEAIHARLEAMVFMVLSVRRSLVPSAQALAWFPAARVSLMLGQIERVAQTSVELAYHLCTQAPEPIFVTSPNSFSCFQRVAIFRWRCWSLHLGALGAGIDEGLLGLSRQMG
jgi:hypothetical protein